VSVTLALALLLQAAGIILLRHRLGRRWIRHPGALLILTASVYDGVSPLLMTIPSVGAWDTYRQGIASSFADDGIMLLSAGMLAFTIAYLLTCPERADAPAAQADAPAAQGDAAVAARALDWRLLALACAPLAVLTYEGKGYNSGTTITGAPVTKGLAATFFTVLIVLAAFAFLLRHGSRWFLPVLAAQSLLLAAAGERTPVIIDAVVLGVLLARTGRRPATRQAHAAVALTLLGVLAITGVRAEQGRSFFYAGSSGLSARLEALGSGLSTGSQQGPGLLAQGAVRLDGYDFAGAVLQSEHMGQQRLAATAVPESLLLAVPSAAWGSKLAHGSALNPGQAEISAFGLQDTNFLPGFAGLYIGFLPPAWLIAFLAFIGAVAGWCEKWLLRECTPARLVVLAGAVTAALWQEPGLPGMLLDLRAAVVIAVAAKVMEAARGWRSAASRVVTS
jgi:hypothetical protein